MLRATPHLWATAYHAGRVDMGAYEFGIGDFDCNQAVDLADFAGWEGCATDPFGTSAAMMAHQDAPHRSAATMVHQDAPYKFSSARFGAEKDFGGHSFHGLRFASPVASMNVRCVSSDRRGRQSDLTLLSELA